MAAKKEDYLMQLVEALGAMVQSIIKLRQDGRLSEALAMVIATQEKLFGRPAMEISSLPITEQLRQLCLNEPPDSSRAKRLIYAATLREAGLTYRERNKENLAQSAFQLSLYVMLTVASEPGAAQDQLRPGMAELMAWLPPENLYPPTVELLKKMSSAAAQ